MTTTATPRQRTKSDCVVAAIAAATGQPYRVVKAKCGPIRGGLERHEYEWLLTEFGNWRKWSPRSITTANAWAAKRPTQRAVLIVEGSVLFGDVHAVTAIDGKIVDPSDGGDSARQVLAAYILDPPPLG